MITPTSSSVDQFVPFKETAPINPSAEYIAALHAYANAANWYVDASDGQLQDAKESRGNARVRMCVAELQLIKLGHQFHQG